MSAADRARYAQVHRQARAALGRGVALVFARLSEDGRTRLAAQVTAYKRQIRVVPAQ